MRDLIDEFLPEYSVSVTRKRKATVVRTSDGKWVDIVYLSGHVQDWKALAENIKRVMANVQPNS